jgi:serine/threonine protein kinase
MNQAVSHDGLQRPAPSLANSRECRRMQKLGQGTFGSVYKCIWRSRTFAVKVKKSDGAQDREISILRILGAGGGHTSVVTLLRWRKEPATRLMSLYFPMFPLDLKDLLRRHLSANTNLELQAALHIASKLCAAGSFMHSRCVLHRDLKPRNILMRRCESQPGW